MSIIPIIILILVIIFFIARARSGPRSPAISPTPSFGSTPAAPPPPTPQNVEGALALLASCVHPRGGGELTGVIQVQITDHSRSEWSFEFSQGSCSLSSGQSDRATLTLKADSRTWIDLANKQLSFAGAAMKGQLQSEGDTGTLMRLDNEFSGAPDPSRLTSSVSNAADDDDLDDDDDDADDDEDSSASSRATTSIGLGAALSSADAFREAVRAARENPNLSREEQRQAMINALRQKLAPGSEIKVTGDNVISLSATSTGGSTSTPSPANSLHAAIQKAIQNLPPGASRAQKAEAIRAVLREMQGTGSAAALFGAGGLAHLASGSEGVGGEVVGEVAGEILQTMFDGLLGGGGS